MLGKLCAIVFALFRPEPAPRPDIEAPAITIDSSGEIPAMNPTAEDLRRINGFLHVQTPGVFTAAHALIEYFNGQAATLASVQDAQAVKIFNTCITRFHKNTIFTSRAFLQAFFDYGDTRYAPWLVEMAHRCGFDPLVFEEDNGQRKYLLAYIISHIVQITDHSSLAEKRCTKKHQIIVSALMSRASQEKDPRSPFFRLAKKAIYDDHLAHPIGTVYKEFHSQNLQLPAEIITLVPQEDQPRTATMIQETRT